MGTSEKKETKRKKAITEIGRVVPSNFKFGITLESLEPVVHFYEMPVEFRVVADNLFTDDKYSSVRKSIVHVFDKLKPGHGPDELEGIVTENCAGIVKLDRSYIVRHKLYGA